MKAKQLGLVALCSTLVLSGCASMNIAPENQNTAKGAAIGAGVGAVLGKATGNHKNKRLAIGAAIGALAGAAVGRYMDHQEMALRDQLSGTGVKVHRDGDILRLEIPSQITFAVNQSSIQPQLYPVARVEAEQDSSGAQSFSARYHNSDGLPCKTEGVDCKVAAQAFIDYLKANSQLWQQKREPTVTLLK